jgi:hypothetical protein
VIGVREEWMMSIIPFVLASILVFLVLVVVSRTLVILSKGYRERLEERFPPISDVEFLARCTPGTNPQVALKARRIVADGLGVDYERIYPSSRFVEDLGAD